MNRRAFIATTAAAILGRNRIPAALPRPARSVQIEIRYTSNDVEYLEYRQFQAEEIARIFNVPPRLLATCSRNQPLSW